MTAPFITEVTLSSVLAKRVAFFGIRALKGGKFHPKLNMTTRLIVNKYREGKAKRTLKRELKVLEIVKGEANIAVEYARSGFSCPEEFVLTRQGNRACELLSTLGRGIPVWDGSANFVLGGKTT